MFCVCERTSEGVVFVPTCTPGRIDGRGEPAQGETESARRTRIADCFQRWKRANPPEPPAWSIVQSRRERRQPARRLRCHSFAGCSARSNPTLSASARHLRQRDRQGDLGVALLSPDDLDFRPDPKSSTVADILNHELLLEPGSSANLWARPNRPSAEVLPKTQELSAYIQRKEQLARPRLHFFAAQSADWWMQDVPFLRTARQRIWCSGAACCIPAITARN